jgi:plastocyanin
MLTKRLMVAVVGCLLLGSTPLVVSSTAGAEQTAKVVNIVGKDSFSPNQFLLNTFRFEPGLITVHQGQRVLFNNKTTDGHNMTLVAKGDLPRTIPQVFNCNLCNTVNEMYLPTGNPPPAGVQIDHGVLNDDEADHDADATDPAAGGFPGALIEDFNTVSHSNPTGPATIGDSTLVAPVGQPPAPTSRTIVVTAKPGTTLHYYCTFHPWMQATILVTSPVT